MAIELAAARVAVLPPPAMLAHWDVGGRPRRAGRARPAAAPADAAARVRLELRRCSTRPSGRCCGGWPRLPAVSTWPPWRPRAAGTVRCCRRSTWSRSSRSARLIDRSLVERDADGPASTPSYRQLRTVREYLRERLALAGEQDAADLLMARWCAEVARSVRGLQLHGSREQLDALEPRARQPARRARGADPARAGRGRRLRRGSDRPVEGAPRARGTGVGGARARGGRRRAIAGERRARGLWTGALLAYLQGDYEAQTRLAGDRVWRRRGRARTGDAGPGALRRASAACADDGVGRPVPGSARAQRAPR